MRKKERSFLLVDGYNIIHAWDELKRLAEESLEDARDRLVDILSDYNGSVDSTIIVVFDAHKVRGGIGTQILHNNIYVVYTKEAETADHYIERSVSEIVRNYNVSVATSDNLEQVIILAEGAVRISARELLHQINTARTKLRKNYLEKSLKKENMLFDNLSPDIVDLLEELRLK